MLLIYKYQSILKGYKCISMLHVLVLEQYLAYVCYTILRMTSAVFQYIPWRNVMSRVG